MLRLMTISKAEVEGLGVTYSYLQSLTLEAVAAYRLHSRTMNNLKHHHVSIMITEYLQTITSLGVRIC